MQWSLSWNWVWIELVRLGPSSIGKGDDELLLFSHHSPSLCSVPLVQQQWSSKCGGGATTAATSAQQQQQELEEEAEGGRPLPPFFVLRPCSDCTSDDCEPAATGDIWRREKKTIGEEGKELVSSKKIWSNIQLTATNGAWRRVPICKKEMIVGWNFFLCFWRIRAHLKTDDSSGAYIEFAHNIFPYSFNITFLILPLSSDGLFCLRGIFFPT